MEDVQHIPEKGVILYVGRLSQQKRLESLVKAYGACKSSNMRERKRTLPPLSLVGGGDHDALEKIAEQCGIQNDVCFHNQQPNPERFFPNAVCFINPSESEGFPNAVLEACAFGVPVILSDIPVHRKIAVDVGMEDFVYPVGDEWALSKKLLAFLNLTKEQIVSKRIRCAEYARKRSCQIRDDAYLALYEKVLKRNKG
jgi:glycosyltransferase involved in cell wall biosynthesis